MLDLAALNDYFVATSYQDSAHNAGAAQWYEESNDNNSVSEDGKNENKSSYFRCRS